MSFAKNTLWNWNWLRFLLFPPPSLMNIPHPRQTYRKLYSRLYRSIFHQSQKRYNYINLKIWIDTPYDIDERFNFSTLSDLIPKVTSFAVSSHPMRNWYKYIERKCSTYWNGKLDTQRSKTQREVHSTKKKLPRRSTNTATITFFSFSSSSFFATRQRNPSPKNARRKRIEGKWKRKRRTGDEDTG